MKAADSSNPTRLCPCSRSSIVLAILVSAVAAQHAFATIWYVDADASGSNTGLSWDHAFNDLQDALAVATGGDEVWVAEGIYTPAAPMGPRTATFQLLNGVAVYGGYAGHGQVNPDERNILAYETTISGCTISGNSANGSGGGAYSHMYSSATVIDSTIAGNSANDRAGGIGCFTGCSVTIKNCKVIGNSAAHDGGGMYCYGFSAMSYPTITNCTVTRHSAGDGGGGISCYWMTIDL